MSKRRAMAQCAFVAGIVLYIAGMFFVSLQSIEVHSPTMRVINNLTHIPVFMVLTVLLYLAVSRAAEKPLLALASSAAAAFVLGVVIEFAQAYIPGRERSLLDVMLNFTGIVAGSLIVSVYLWRKT